MIFCLVWDFAAKAGHFRLKKTCGVKRLLWFIWKTIYIFTANNKTLKFCCYTVFHVLNIYQWLCGNSCTWAHDVCHMKYIYILYIYIYIYIYLLYVYSYYIYIHQRVIFLLQFSYIKHQKATILGIYHGRRKQFELKLEVWRSVILVTHFSTWEKLLSPKP